MCLGWKDWVAKFVGCSVYRVLYRLSVDLSGVLGEDAFCKHGIRMTMVELSLGTKKTTFTKVLIRT